MNKDKNLAVRLPAEWEEQGAVLVAWPHENTDWAYMLDEAQECYVRLIEAISRHAFVVVVAPDTDPVKDKLRDIDNSRILCIDVPTNDTWTRDYGVITTFDENGNAILCDFGFNAWGNKFESRLDNNVTRFLNQAGLIRGVYRDLNEFILEGGSIESDGRGTLLTTESCLLTPTRNPDLSRQDIEQNLKEILGVKKVLWLDCGSVIGDDTDGHIDTIARFAPENTILYIGGQQTIEDPQIDMLTGIESKLKGMTNANGEPFNLIELPMPEPIYDKDDGHRLPATYANFLVINDAVMMPSYGQPLKDELAEMTLKVAFPNHKIERVDCRALIRQHGSLHCATMQLPKEILPF